MSTITSKCSSAVKKYTVTETSATNAYYKSPAGMSISAHTSLAGVMSAPASNEDGSVRRLHTEGGSSGRDFGTDRRPARFADPIRI